LVGVTSAAAAAAATAAVVTVVIVVVVTPVVAATAAAASATATVTAAATITTAAITSDDDDDDDDNDDDDNDDVDDDDNEDEDEDEDEDDEDDDDDDDDDAAVAATAATATNATNAAGANATATAAAAAAAATTAAAFPPMVYKGVPSVQLRAFDGAYGARRARGAMVPSALAHLESRIPWEAEALRLDTADMNPGTAPDPTSGPAAGPGAAGPTTGPPVAGPAAATGPAFWITYALALNILLILGFCLVKRAKFLYKLRNIPSPKALPFLGNAIQLNCSNEGESQRIRALRNAAPTRRQSLRPQLSWGFFPFA
jgi:hypothetical protein